MVHIFSQNAMKNKFIAGAFLILCSAAMLGNDDCRLVITQEEESRMLNEADDFIDAIPEGLQDMQADAVLHALQGSQAELERVRNSRNAAHECSAGVAVKDIVALEGVARGIPMRLYQPENASGEELPILIYLHGGGWTFGSLNSCAAFCDALASEGNVNVLAVDYSLAPENPFPRALSDCVSVVEYASENARELGSAPGLISIGGDSSGGNLALAAALYFTENKIPGDSLRSIVLYYPVVNVENENVGSWKKYSRGYGLDRRLMDAFIQAYDDKGRSPDSIGNLPKHALISPAKATVEQLAALPPMLMISAERDILCDQGADFANKIKAARGSVKRVEFPGAVHLFITVNGQPTAFRKAVALTSDFLQK